MGRVEAARRARRPDTPRPEFGSRRAGELLQHSTRGQEPQHPVERDDGLADLESLPRGDRLGAASFLDCRLEPHLADDLDDQAVDKLVVQEVRPEKRDVDDVQKIRRKHLREQRGDRFGLGQGARR